MHVRTERRISRRRRATIASLAAVAVFASSLTATAAFADGGITPPAGLAIQGDLKVGSTVSIPSAGWTPEATTLSVVWKAGDETIVEPEGQDADLSLVVTPAELGETISADVTAKADGFDDVVEHLDAVDPVAAGDFTAAAEPTIQGTAAVGATLTADAGDWSPSATFAYEWQVDGAIVSTESSYVPVAADLGKSVTVTVTGSADGYTSVAKTSSAVTVAAGTIAAPTPTISGNAGVGSTVTAVAAGWAPEPASFTYAWTVDGGPVGDGSATYTPTVADQGKLLAVAVTGVVDGYTQASATSDEVKVAGHAYAPSTGPSMTGALRVDSTVTASPGAWSEANTQFSYIWAIDGATVAKGTTFKPAAAQRGKTVVLTVTATAPGFEGSASVSGVIGYGVFTTKPVPTVSGTIRVGNKLTAKPGTWAPSASFTYAWKVSGATVSTASTFTPTSTQLNKGLTLTVTASRAGYSNVSQSTSSVKIGYGIFSAPTPKISGSAIVGKTLTVSTGTWTPSATKTYRWYRNGIAISGATGTSHKVTSTDYGKKLTVKVTGKRTAYTTKTVTSASTATVVKPFTRTTAPTITGTTRVNSTLTAHIGSWSPTTSSHSWQWKRNGVAISGATGSTHKLTTSDYGKKITVTYTGRRGGYATTARTSASTTTILGPAATLKGDGFYTVGTQLKPGTYYANAPIDCYWERFDAYGNSLGWGYAWASGRQIVTIASGDAYFGTAGCGSWTTLLKLTAPATTVGNGMQKVGVTMQPGHYVSGATGDACYVEVLSGFGGSDSDLIDRWPPTDNDSGSSGGLDVYLDSSTVGFASYDCGTWTRVGD